MNSQKLLYINIIIGVLFLLYFLFGRPRPKEPTRLKLKNPDSPEEGNSSAEKPAGFVKISQKNQQSGEYNPQVTVLEPEDKSSSQKELAIFFMYNGHDWEAHDVLGVPQGANLKVVTEKYQKLLAENNTQSYDFLEAAYQAILKRKRNTVL